MTQPLAPGDPANLGGYQLLGRLGAGGQGVVYLGRADDGTHVAVKTLNTDSATGPDFRQRFAQEAEAARQVASFCTAAVLAADVAAEPPYIVSEYVDGPSLRDAIVRDGPLTGGDLHRVAVAVATALMAIHEAGIVHRDLKPANVLLGQGGARVIDFGVARVSQGAGTLTNSAIGTPGYMAPEQIAGDPVSPKSDVFAWGTVVAFAATGRNPFDGETVPAILHRVLDIDPDLAGVPESLRALVTTALRKDPAERPTSTDVLMTLIGRTERPTDPDSATRVLREAATISAAGQLPPPGQPTATRYLGDNSTPPAREPSPQAPPVQPPSPAGTPGRDPRARGPLVRAGAGGLAVGLVAGILVGWLLLPGGAGSQGSAVADGGDVLPPEDTEPAAELPRFGPDFAGDWTGETPGVEWQVSIEEGDRGATIESEGEWNCAYDIVLGEVTEEGYRAEASSSEMMLCEARSAELSVSGSLLNVEVFASEEPNGDPTESVRFERA